MQRSAIIVGAGIGGLTTAIALARAGWTVDVLEQAPEISEIGAGLQVGPNGMRILDALGVTPQIEASLFEPEAIEMRLGGSERMIFRMPVRKIAERRWGARYIQIHRADLVAGLLATLAELAPDAVRTGMHVTGYAQDQDRARVQVGTETVEADLIVAADGIHSTVRTQMLGADQPRFTGNVAYRAVIPAERLGDAAPPPSAVVWAGPGRHAVTTRLRAGTMVNFVGLIEEDAWREEGWDLTVPRATAQSAFSGWSPALERILAEADIVHRWALFDRPQLPKWSDGRVVLLGDACHPMLPSLAQGAVQAMEDSAALVEALTAKEDIVAAGHAYYRARIARATLIQRRSAANARLFHRRSALDQFAHYAPIWLAHRVAPWVFPMRLDWLYARNAS